MELKLISVFNDNLQMRPMRGFFEQNHCEVQTGLIKLNLLLTVYPHR